MTTVYVVMHNDRHTDTEATVFASSDDAIAYARDQARECARQPEDIEEDFGETGAQAGWLYYCRYSGEGDDIWVVSRDVRDARATGT